MVDIFVHAFDLEFQKNFISDSNNFYNNYESTLYTTMIDNRGAPLSEEFGSLAHVGYIQDISLFYKNYWILL